MRRFFALFLALPLLAWTTAAQAYIETYTTFMSGPNESPANASPGTGTGIFVYDSTAHTFSYDVSFSGLTGNTTAAHIHGPTANPGVLTAGVMTTQPYFAGFPIGVTSGSYVNTLDLTLASSWGTSFLTNNGGSPANAETSFINAINAGKAYFNIHTSTFGPGEIRGFLTPEPTTGMLILLGAAALGCVNRGRRC